MKHPIRLGIGIIGLIGVYALQHQIFYNLPFQIEMGPQVYDRDAIDTSAFILSKILRFILNDFFAILVITALFPEKKYLQFAVGVFALGFVVLLPAYLILFLNYFEETFTYQNHIHRVVMNPLLMMLLIPAFYAQKKNSQKAY